MKLLKLKLRGAIGIRKGLGVEEIEIDFSQFESGLIALTGKNGSGKTTIMENLHPYRTMVSRDGSVQSHFYLKDSFRILYFEQNGFHYESKILVDALTGGSEAYLICNGKSLNDGKLTTYDEAIEQVLGSQELFFNSVFSGQKSKGIAELKPADRRKLFYELLNLDIYEQYLEKAKAELKSNELRLSEIEGEISALSKTDISIDELRQEKIVLCDKQNERNTQLKNLEDEIGKLQEEIKQKEINLKLLEQKLEQNSDIDQKLQKIEIEIGNNTKEHNSKIVRHNSDVTDNEKLIARDKKLLENKTVIEKNLKDINALDCEIFDLNESKSKLSQEFSTYQTNHNIEIGQLQKREKKLSDDRLFLQKLESNYNQKRYEINGIQEEANLINEVPCTEEVGSRCQFLIKAYQGKEQLSTLLTNLDSLYNQLISYREELSKEEKDFTKSKQIIDENYTLKLSSYKSDLNNLTLQIEEKEKQLNQLKQHDWDKMKSEAQEAENHIKLCEQKIFSIKEMIESAKNDFDNTLNRLKNESKELYKKLDNTLPETIQNLSNEIDDKKHVLMITETELKVLQGVIDEADKYLASLNVRIDQLARDEKKIEELRQVKVKTEQEIKEWNFLCKAFDKTGIPVLKLENSGIEITSIANELLSIFENKFRIVFETTKLKADKKSYKESFDINIVEDDGVTEISNKSGGQQVWLETALQLAIAQVVRQQGRNVQTSFLDEKDGALDLDNAFCYIEMLKKAHELSGVYNTFIITHRTELLDFIPQQIRLRDGILEVMN